MVNAGVRSTVLRGRQPRGVAARLEQIQVPVVDIFELIGSIHIDLLKIDCEGAEYEILMDPRFGALDANNLVLEWHATEEHPAAERDIIGRLRELNWTVDPISHANVKVLDGFGVLRVGMLWAFRQ
jgi:hypothetical protein